MERRLAISGWVVGIFRAWEMQSVRRSAMRSSCVASARNKVSPAHSQFGPTEPSTPQDAKRSATRSTSGDPAAMRTVHLAVLLVQSVQSVRSARSYGRATSETGVPHVRVLSLRFSARHVDHGLERLAELSVLIRKRRGWELASRQSRLIQGLLAPELPILHSHRSRARPSPPCLGTVSSEPPVTPRLPIDPRHC